MNDDKKPRLIALHPNRGPVTAIQTKLCELLSNVFTRVPVIQEGQLPEKDVPTLYVLETQSFLDYTILTRYLHNQGRSSPCYLVKNKKPIQKYPANVPPNLMAHKLNQGRDIVFHLHGPDGFLWIGHQRWQRKQSRRLADMLEWIQNHSENPQFKEALIVPVLSIWSREPEHILPTFGDRLFGSNIAPSWLRRLFQVAYNWKFAHLYLLKPIPIKEYLEQLIHKDRYAVTHALRKEVYQALGNRRRIATGPMLKWKRKVIEQVVRDKNLSRTIDLLAKKEGNTHEELQTRARQLLTEIAAEYSLPHAGFAHWLYQQLFKLSFYRLEVDESGFDRVRKAATRGHPVVMVPCHKSHMDYMVVTDLFYCRLLTPPLIAAGENLNFWPVGYLFRRVGAFFIRRRIRGDLLYARVLENYIRILLKEGYNQEFFFEGGRSRDGKLMEPKLGILSMTVDAFLNSEVEDLTYIPISIAYDKVMEDRAYMKELQGGEKIKETFLTALNSVPDALRQHGKVYIDFGNPISLKHLAGEQTGNLKRIRRTLIKDLATEIIANISDVYRVTPSSLLATVLLTQNRESRSFEDLVDASNEMIELITTKEIRISSTFGDTKNAVKLGLKIFKRFNILEVVELDNKKLYRPVENKRILLDYYRNHIFHHFLGEAMLLFALKATSLNSRDEVLNNFVHYANLLKREFVKITGSEEWAVHLFNKATNRLRQIGALPSEESSFALNESKHPRLLEAFAMGLAPFFEALSLVAKYFLSHHEVLLHSNPPDTLNLMSFWKSAYFEGRIRFAESGTTAKLDNAAATLLDHVEGLNGSDAVDKIETLDSEFDAILKTVENYPIKSHDYNKRLKLIRSS